MGYKRKRGGYAYNGALARGHAAVRKQREIVTRILETGPTQAQLYQLLTALMLANTQINEALDDLAEFDQ